MRRGAALRKVGFFFLLEAAHVDVLHQPDTQQHRNQRAAAVTDKRQRQAGDRQEAQIDPNIDNGLKAHQDPKSIGNQRAVGIGRVLSHLETAHNHKYHRRHNQDRADKTEFVRQNREIKSLWRIFRNRSCTWLPCP